jgi:hypothetical protein
VNDPLPKNHHANPHAQPVHRNPVEHACSDGHGGRAARMADSGAPDGGEETRGRVCGGRGTADEWGWAEGGLLLPPYLPLLRLVLLRLIPCGEGRAEFGAHADACAREVAVCVTHALRLCGASTGCAGAIGSAGALPLPPASTDPSSKGSMGGGATDCISLRITEQREGDERLCGRGQRSSSESNNQPSELPSSATASISTAPCWSDVTLPVAAMGQFVRVRLRPMQVPTHQSPAALLLLPVRAQTKAAKAARSPSKAIVAAENGVQTTTTSQSAARMATTAAIVTSSDTVVVAVVAQYCTRMRCAWTNGVASWRCDSRPGVPPYC